MKNTLFTILLTKNSTNMKKKLLLPLALMLLMPLGMLAQNFTVKGNVADATGEPVIGASVKVVGNGSVGTITDYDGNFALEVPSAARQLEVSYVGMATKRVNISRGASVKVVLEEDTENLDEVVVVGYGVQKKSDVTGALARVNSAELTTRPVNNPFEALQGKVAGVDITSNERPGEIGSILIRGSRSIKASNSPLYVVDGVPLSSGGIETINPRDIESIDILKDASSTAIYGSRGANGVVLITTKRGQAGQMKLNYSGTVTFEKLVDKQPAMTASDYITWRRWAYHNSNPEAYTPGDQPTYEQDQNFFSGDPDALANVNKGWANGQWNGDLVSDTQWEDFVTRTGVTHEHTVSASGGSENVQGMVSVGYLNNEGTQMGQQYQRFNFAANVDVKAKPWFKVGAGLNTSFSEQKYGYSRTGQSSNSGPTDIYNAAKALPHYTVPYDADGDIVTNPGGSVVNAYTVIDEWTKSNDNRETFRVLGSFYGLVDFGKIWAPLEGLTFKSNFGPDLRFRRNGIFIDATSAVKMGSKNYASDSMNRYFSWTLDNMINYDRTFGDHKIGLTLLQSASKYNFESMNESANMIPDSNYLWYYMSSIDITDAATYGASMSTGLSETALASYMARLNYSLLDRYLLTISGRYDGASVLAAGHKWDFFPSAALGWRIDQEEFMQDVDWVSQLKLRLGIGTTGNSAVSAYSTLGNIQGFFIPFNTGNEQAYATNEPYYTSNLISLANKELGWEKTTQYNFGIDFSFLKGRIGGSLDLYRSDTRDLLLPMSIPTITGYSSTTANIGRTANHGVELGVNFIPVQTKSFQWTSNLNFAWQKNRIVEVANGPQDDVSNQWFIGYPIGVWYTYEVDGLWQAEDAAEMAKFNENGAKFEVGMVKPVDQEVLNEETGEYERDYIIDDKDRVIIGQKSPTLTFGWNNRFNYKQFELAVELYGRAGYMISTGGEGQLGMYAQRQIDYWTPSNTDAEYQKPIYNTSGGDPYSGLLGFRDAAFIKVRNVSLGYYMPKKVCKNLGIQDLKIYAQGKNLGNLYSTVDFLDLDLGTSFYNRGFTMGLQIGF